MTVSEVRNFLIENGINLSKLAIQLGLDYNKLNQRLRAQNFKKKYIDEIEEKTGLKITLPQNTDNPVDKLLESQLLQKDQEINGLLSLLKSLQDENLQLKKEIDKLTEQKTQVKEKCECKKEALVS